MSVEIVKGSILDQNVDAIVNPANSFLNHAGGLARVIDSAATNWGLLPNNKGNEGLDGPYGLTTNEFEGLRAQQARYHEFDGGLVPTGAAILSPPGLLAHRGIQGIIHAVGPIWGGGGYEEKVLLRLAYDSALRLAEQAGFQSIAVPAISAGIFGVPIDVVAQAAMAMLNYTDLRVVVALMEDSHVEAFNMKLKSERRNYQL